MGATIGDGKVHGAFAWLPGAAAVLAFLACNGIIVLVAILSFFGIGIAIAINPHLQAAAISFFALLTIVFTYTGYRKHRIIGPLVLSVLGALQIIGTIYISFSKVVESLGLLTLIGAAIWNWRSVKEKGLAWKTWKRGRSP